MTAMNEAAPLTQTEVRDLADRWFAGLNDHIPLVEMLDIVTTDGLHMEFPEAMLDSTVAFERWYHDVTHRFFDQEHIVTSFEADIDGDRAAVRVTVIWKASEWTPPAAYSNRIAMEAYQEWEVARSPQTGKPVIVNYQVKSLEPVADQPAAAAS